MLLLLLSLYCTIDLFSCKAASVFAINLLTYLLTYLWLQDSYVMKMTSKPSKLGQTDPVLFSDQSSSVDLCVLDDNSLRLAVIVPL